MPESFFKVDVNLPDHPKIVGLSDAGFRVYMASIGYANRLMTDGFIATAIARRLHDCDWGESSDTPEEHARELVAAKLWEPVEGGWLVHDFLDHNRSREERLSDRDRERDRKAAYRRRQRGEDPGPPGTDPPGNSSVPGGVPPGQDGTVPQVSQIPRDAMSRRIETETEIETEDKINPVVEQARPVSVLPTAEERVFTTWQASTGKHKAKLDHKRRRKIQQALRSYPLEDVLDAVRGWKNSPHHCGQNDRGTVYNDLELLLRDAAHIEQFRDLARDGPGTRVTPMGKRTRQMVATYEQMHAYGVAKGLISGNGSNGLGGVAGDRGQAQRELARPADRATDGG